MTFQQEAMTNDRNKYAVNASRIEIATAGVPHSAKVAKHRKHKTGVTYWLAFRDISINH